MPSQISYCRYNYTRKRKKKIEKKIYEKTTAKQKSENEFRTNIEDSGFVTQYKQVFKDIVTFIASFYKVLRK